MKGISKKDLALWREKHFKELEECLKVSIAIRDDPEAGAKNRIEAVKIISRLLNALQPEKGEAASKLIPSNKKAGLDPDHEKRLNEILNKLP